jgi:hypothetical protein
LNFNNNNEEHQGTSEAYKN